jgi:hypothetical protein
MGPKPTAVMRVYGCGGAPFEARARDDDYAWGSHVCGREAQVAQVIFDWMDTVAAAGK